MSTTNSKKYTAVFKNFLQIALYVLLGLALSLLLNQTIYAAEHNYPLYPFYDDITVDDSFDYLSEPPPQNPATGWLLITAVADNTGERLSGVTYEIRRALGDELVTVGVTDFFGEISVELETGSYFLREVSALPDFINDSSRINFTISEGVRTDIYTRKLPIAETPQPTPTPAPDTGRLLVTSKAKDTGAFLAGVAFEIRSAMDDAYITQVTTNQYGEASVNLPVGNYFLREVEAPSGYVPDSSRRNFTVSANRVSEVTVLSVPIPEVPQPTLVPVPTLPPIPTQPPSSQITPIGRLLITNKAQGTGVLLQGAVFEIRSIMDDRLMATTQADQYGEAVANLPVGDYYIRNIVPATGYALDSARTNIKIAAGELLSVSIASMVETANVNDDETAEYGRLLVTLVSNATGERIMGATITIHDVMTDAIIVTMSTNNFGEASAFLAANRYYMRHMFMPEGYLYNLDRIPITIKPAEIAEMTLTAMAVSTPSPTPTPRPVQAPARTPAASTANTRPVITETPPNNERHLGRIEIITRAAGSGNRLSGGVFAIFRASDNRNMGELITGADGMAHLMAEPGMYYIREMRPTFGFYLETERIYLEVNAGESVKVELTKERDATIIDLPADGDGSGFIYITQTGYNVPIRYIGGRLLIAIAVIFACLAGVLLSRQVPIRRVLYG